jgi:hypothetical protein
MVAAVSAVVVVVGSVLGFAAVGRGSAEARGPDGRSGKGIGGGLSIRAGGGLADGFGLGPNPLTSVTVLS